MKKVWQFHKTYSALLRVSTNNFPLRLVLESQEQEIGPKWKNGKETLHFPTAACGFLISVCKGKPGAGGLSDCSCPHPPITLLPPHLVPGGTLTS